MQFLFKTPFLKRLVITALFAFLSLYLVYEQVVDCRGIGLEVQKQRHENFMRGESDFFNPWQYRVLSPFILQGIINAWEWTTSSIAARLPYKDMQPYFPYFILRFIQNLLIFFAAYKYYKVLGIKSTLFILMGILLLGYNMSNSNFASDLSFNTYFDVLFYLVAGYLILQKKEMWIIPLTFIAALNRETSGFIPVIFLLMNINFREFKIPPAKIIIVFILSIFLFAAAYLGTRGYYGIRPYHGINNLDTPLEFLKFNLTFGSLYPELFGTLGFVFALALIKYKRWNYSLKLFFWTVVPVWFIVHFVKSQAMETRLFLVPHAFVFIPALLWVIQTEYFSQLQSQSLKPLQ